MALSGIRDGQWNSSFVRLALRYHAPIVPVLVEAGTLAFLWSV